MGQIHPEAMDRLLVVLEAFWKVVFSGLRWGWLCFVQPQLAVEGSDIFEPIDKLAGRFHRG